MRTTHQSSFSSIAKYKHLWNPFGFGSVNKCSLLKRALHLGCINPEGRHYQAGGIYHKTLLHINY